MTITSAIRRRGRNLRFERRRRLALERLEDRRLLTWTFSISGSVASAVSDGSADTLYIAESNGFLYHSVDGVNFISDWSGTGTTLAASTSSTVNIDPTSGSNAHNLFLGTNLLSPATSIQAQINIQNGGSNVSLTIDDSTDTSAASGTNAYVINNGTISTPLGLNVHATGGVLGGGILLKGGTPADTYNLTSTRSGEPVTLTGGNGGNTFNLTGSSSPVTINVGNGTNTVSLGGASGVGAQNLSSSINLNGSGSTIVAIDDLLGTTTPETVNLTATQITGLGPATIDFSGLSNISIFAFGTTNLGGATINVAGAPVTTNVVRIVVGSGGTNSIKIGDATHAASSLPADQFQFISTGGTTNLTIDDSANSSAATATLSSSTLSFGVTQLPKFNYTSASLASLAFYGGSGGNTINVNSTPASITTTIHSGSGVDSVNVQATGAGGTLNLDTQGGNSADLVTLGGAAGAGAQNLNGALSIASTGGAVALTVDDSQDTTGRTVTLNASQLSGLTPTAINLASSLSSLTVKGGSGGNTFNVTGTPDNVGVTLDTGDGDDTVNVQGTGSGGSLTIDTQGSPLADQVTLGGVIGVGAQGLLEPITVQSSGGLVSLTIDDSLDTTNHSNVVLSGAQLTGLTPAAINFLSLSDLTIDASSGTDAIVVTGTPPIATLTLTMSSSTTNTLSLGDPTHPAISLGSMTLNGTFGLTIDDSADTFGGTLSFQGTGISFGGGSLPTFSYFGDYIETLSIKGPATAAMTVDVAFTPYLAMGNQILVAMGSSTSNLVQVGVGGLGASRLNGVTVTGTTALTIDDTNSTGARTASITASSLDFGLPLPHFDYSGASLNRLTFNANASGTTANVNSSPAAVSGLAPITLAMGSAPANAVNLGDATHAASALGNVTITGTTGLTVDDSASASPQTISLDAAQLSFGLAPLPTFDYSGASLNSLTFNGGWASNTLFVNNTPDSITTDINSGTGVDNIQVQATGAGGTLNLDTQGGNSADLVTLGGAAGAGAQNLQGTIHVTSTGGYAVLDIDDALDPNGQSATLGSVSPTEASLTGLAPATINVSLASVGNLGIETGSASNSLTIDCSAGNPLPVILRFSGSGANTLNLQGSGAHFSTERYVATGPGAGSINFDSTYQILFSQLVPINDVVPAPTFDFVAPTSSTAFDITDGPTFNGFATTQISSPTNAFELINFANKTNASASASNSGTTINLNNPNGNDGIETLTIYGGQGNDTVNVHGVPNAVETSILLDGGDDHAVVDPAALPASGTLNIDGGNGTNGITVNATTTTVDTSTAGTVTFGTGSSFDYQNIQTLDITAINRPPVLSAAGSLSATQGVSLINVVVAQFNDPDTFETANSYQATIDWGDGTTTTATVVADALVPGRFRVLGSHAYQATGTFTTLVSITDLGGSFPSTVGATSVTTTLDPLPSPITGQGAIVTVQKPPVIYFVSGGLTPGSITGPTTSNGFAITRINTPSFTGTATPGAIIRIYATSTNAGAPDLLIATATADASGHWAASDTSYGLPDGSFVFHATASPPAIVPAGMFTVAPLGSSSTTLGQVLLDTQRPVVTGLTFDRLHGQLTLTFQDGLSGLDRASLANLANYQVWARPLSPRIHVPRTLTVTDIALSPQGSPTAPVTVVLKLNHGQPLRGGRYFVNVSGSGITDLAANGLDGAFNGTFPTGGGLDPTNPSPTPSNFDAEVTTFHRRTLPPTPVTSTTSASHTRTVRPRSAHPTLTPLAPQAAHLHDAALAALATSPRHKHRPR